MNKETKIAIFSPTAKIWGGGQIYVERLQAFLIEKGIDTQIVTPPQQFKGPKIEIPDVSNPLVRLLKVPFIAMRLRRDGFNTVILNDLASSWLAPIFKILGFRTLCLLHLFLQKRSQNTLGHSTFAYPIIKNLTAWSDFILTVNKENLTVFKKNIKFVGNAIDPLFIETPLPDSEEKIYDVGLIGRFAPQKNIPLYLDLVDRLTKIRGSESKYLLLGEGPDEKAILKEIDDRGLTDQIDVNHWLQRDQLLQIYSQIKVFAVSSLHEGFPTTLLEAHARGCPAVVTRRAGYSGEFIEEAPQLSGLVFEEKDVEDPEFIESVSDVIDHYADYRELTRKKAANYSEDRVFGTIADAISEVSTER